ncbi:flagellar capping protein [compost metagenome]
MYKQIDKSLTQLVDKAGKVGAATDLVTNTLGDQISKLNKKITDMTSRLADKEEYYYKMFAAMDTAVGNSNSTLSWLSSQMG